MNFPTTNNDTLSPLPQFLLTKEFTRSRCSGIDYLILAAMDDMRNLTCSNSDSKQCPIHNNDNKSKTKAPSIVASPKAILMTAESPPQRSSSNDKVNGNRKKIRSWDESFEALVVYAQEHGTTAVPVRYKKDTALANWVRYQQRNHDALSATRRKNLESIGFHFGARNDRTWNLKFERFQEYLEQESDRGKNTQTLIRDNVDLSQWVSTQRSLYKKDLLRDDRRAKLDGIGFCWQVKNSKSDSDGRACPDKRGKNIDLSDKGTKSTTNGNTAEARRREDLWFANFKKLKAFHREHNHLLVPCHYEQDEGLGVWVSNQRSTFHRGILSPNRKQLLDDIGFVWRVEAKQARADLYQRQWDQHYELLCQYKQVHGHVNVSSDGEDSDKLGLWVVNQKESARRGSLNPVRAERLLSIGLSLGEERESYWTKSFLTLKKSLEDNTPHQLISCEDLVHRDVKLGNWLKLQGLAKKYDHLPLKRQFCLERLGLQWDDLSFGPSGASAPTTSEMYGTSSEEPHLIPESSPTFLFELPSDKSIKANIVTAKRLSVFSEQKSERPLKKARYAKRVLPIRRHAEIITID